MPFTTAKPFSNLSMDHESLALRPRPLRGIVIGQQYPRTAAIPGLGHHGLLHDTDYDRWPKDHPKRDRDSLREQGEEEMAYAVTSHQTKWNLPPKTMMNKCLLACNELTGFIIACCLVRPEGIAT